MGAGGLVRPGGLATSFLCPLFLMIICIIVIICEILSFWEVISSFILDILDSTVKFGEIVLPETIVEAYDFPVALRRPYPQLYIVSSSSSRKYGGSVPPGFFRFGVQDGV